MASHRVCCYCEANLQRQSVLLHAKTEYKRRHIFHCKLPPLTGSQRLHKREVSELQSLGMEALAACGCEAAGKLHLQSARAKRADIGENALAMSIIVVAAASGGVG